MTSCSRHPKEYETGLQLCAQALALARRLDGLDTQALTLDSLGTAHAGLGHDKQALDHNPVVRISTDLEQTCNPNSKGTAPLLPTTGSAYGWA